jgi:hypothetical protein
VEGPAPPAPRAPSPAGARMRAPAAPPPAPPPGQAPRHPPHPPPPRRPAPRAHCKPAGRRPARHNLVAPRAKQRPGAAHANAPPRPPQPPCGVFRPTLGPAWRSPDRPRRRWLPHKRASGERQGARWRARPARAGRRRWRDPGPAAAAHAPGCVAAGPGARPAAARRPGGASRGRQGHVGRVRPRPGGAPGRRRWARVVGTNVAVPYGRLPGARAGPRQKGRGPL